MDRLDFLLLAELRRAPLSTHEALARAIDRSPSSVRKRLAALTEQQVFRGFDAKPAAEVLGLSGIGGGWKASTPFDDILAVEGTIWVGDTMNGETAALGYSRDPRGWVDAVSRVTGCEPMLVAPIDPYRGPVLGPLDLRVLRAMVDAPVTSAEALASASGLSVKTVRARRLAMVESRAIRIEANIRADRTGAIAYYIYVRCDRARLAAVVRALGDAVTFGGDGGVACLFCHASSLREKAERLAAVRALGIEPMEVVQDRDPVLHRAALVEMIDRVLAQWRAPAAGTEAPRRRAAAVRSARRA